MNYKLGQLVYRVFFSISIILLILALWERINRFFGYTFTWLSYEPRQLLEFSAIFMLITIGLLLRQLRDQMKVGN